IYIVHYKEPLLKVLSRLRPYHPENARSRPISEAKQGRAWLVLGWETAWEYQVDFKINQIKKEKKRNGVIYIVHYKEPLLKLFSRLRPYHPENARSRPISEAKQGRAWLKRNGVIYIVHYKEPLLKVLSRLRPYHPENARSRPISEAKQVIYIVHYKEPLLKVLSRLRPYHPENARSRPISEAKQGRAWLVLGWETAWEYQ
ncbi:hypothetical protein KOW79_007188, partial [Hemibagrus wyckioides]